MAQTESEVLSPERIEQRISDIHSRIDMSWRSLDALEEELLIALQKLDHASWRRDFTVLLVVVANLLALLLLTIVVVRS